MNMFKSLLYIEYNAENKWCFIINIFISTVKSEKNQLYVEGYQVKLKIMLTFPKNTSIMRLHSPNIL